VCGPVALQNDLACEFDTARCFRDEKEIAVKRFKWGLLVTMLCVSLIASASAQPTPSATLWITSMQGSVVESAQNIVLAYCFANRLRVISFEVSMNLTVTVGNSTATFRDNGTKEIRVDATNQNYSIGGQSVVAFRLADQRGAQRSVGVVYAYVGDGSFPLVDGDANSTVRAFVPTINSRIVSADMSSGEAQAEITLGLQRQ